MKLNKFIILSYFTKPGHEPVMSHNRWVFQAKNGSTLREHRDTPIRRHVKVKGTKSPYDGDWAYWGTRVGNYPNLDSLKAQLLKHQQGRCSYCELYFTPEDLIEMHHIDGDHYNSRRSNLTLLHLHCHDQVHAAGTMPLIGTSDKEPDWRGAGRRESVKSGSEAKPEE